jgi:hypothetical protein
MPRARTRSKLSNSQRKSVDLWPRMVIRLSPGEIAKRADLEWERAEDEVGQYDFAVLPRVNGTALALQGYADSVADGIFVLASDATSDEDVKDVLASFGIRRKEISSARPSADKSANGRRKATSRKSSSGAKRSKPTSSRSASSRYSSSSRKTSTRSSSSSRSTAARSAASTRKKASGSSRSSSSSRVRTRSGS